MSLYDPDRRYRRRVWGTITRFGFYIVTLGLAMVFAYQVGVEQTRGRVDRLTQQIAELTAAKATLEQNAIQLQAAAQTAQIQYQELVARFEREVPTGIERQFAEQVARRLGEGLDPERLAFYIDAAQPPRDCGEGESKRFILPTAAYSGANTSVAFSNNRIAVTGRGETGTTESGGTAAWFDTTKPVTVTFRTIDGEQTAAEGVLPLFHAVVLGDQEFRFSVVEAERSFVRVTSEVCAFP